MTDEVLTVSMLFEDTSRRRGSVSNVDEKMCWICQMIAFSTGDENCTILGKDTHLTNGCTKNFLTNTYRKELNENFLQIYLTYAS